jgi:hypothetical protein
MLLLFQVVEYFMGNNRHNLSGGKKACSKELVGSPEKDSYRCSCRDSKYEIHIIPEGSVSPTNVLGLVS